MQDLNTIKTFLAVAEHRSFAGAARALAMTPATVTRAVAALETSLGVQLLLRTTRKVSLTSAGAVYAARVAPLLDAFDQAAEDVREEQGVASGRIRISAPMSMGLRLLPDVVAQFRALYPQTQVSFLLTDRFIDIQTEDVDLAVRISEQPSDKSTIWRKLCPVPRVLVAGPGYLDRSGIPRSPDDLRPLSCLAHAQDARDELWTLTCNGQSRQIRAGATFAANSGDLLCSLARANEGIALLPRFIADPYLNDGTLVQVLPDWHPPEIWLTLYYPPYEQLPLRVALFSDVFETHVTRTKPLNLTGAH